MSLFRRNSKRTSTLQEFARAKDLTLFPKDEMGFIKYFSDFKLFRQGSRRHIRNLIRASQVDHEGDFGLFDYSYTISTGKSSVTYVQTVYFRINKALLLPEFRLFPEKWYHSIGKWFGMQDINLIMYPEFSGEYILQGPDEEMIKTLFDDEHLTTYFRTNQGWTVEATGYYFVMYEHRKLAVGTGLESLLHTGDNLYSILSSRSREIGEPGKL